MAQIDANGARSCEEGDDDNHASKYIEDLYKVGHNHTDESTQQSLELSKESILADLPPDEVQKELNRQNDDVGIGDHVRIKAQGKYHNDLAEVTQTPLYELETRQYHGKFILKIIDDSNHGQMILAKKEEFRKIYPEDFDTITINADDYPGTGYHTDNSKPKSKASTFSTSSCRALFIIARECEEITFVSKSDNSEDERKQFEWYRYAAVALVPIFLQAVMYNLLNEIFQEGAFLSAHYLGNTPPRPFYAICALIIYTYDSFTYICGPLLQVMYCFMEMEWNNFFKKHPNPRLTHAFALLIASYYAVVTGALFIRGLAFLSVSTTNENLLLNVTALHFIWDIDSFVGTIMSIVVDFDEIQVPAKCVLPKNLFELSSKKNPGFHLWGLATKYLVLYFPVLPIIFAVFIYEMSMGRIDHAIDGSKPYWPEIGHNTRCVVGTFGYLPSIFVIHHAMPKRIPLNLKYIIDMALYAAVYTWMYYTFHAEGALTDEGGPVPFGFVPFNGLLAIGVVCVVACSLTGSREFYLSKGFLRKEDLKNMSQKLSFRGRLSFHKHKKEKKISVNENKLKNLSAGAKSMMFDDLHSKGIHVQTDTEVDSASV